ncbi:Type-1A pilin [Cedecea neteri]|uniref:Type 1 fimbrial protein subunit FimI n=1 Tax=Cedecea neteri TaxID=158822 RepID=A0A291E4W9_9ENTR|nr:type 1 fimbrial protein subunit FimI [Cedecea neteri]ATF95097.1 type 1 fimbrial protein subunit FimI [Cedecea neteri]SQA99396.1 Type-1A pilin [Cedecea neteri]
MIRKILLLAILAAVNPVQAKRIVVIHGGEVHMQGELVNGACAVAPESQEMTVQMGQYPSNVFKDVGSYAPPSIPFTLRLTDCRPEVYDHVGIAFQGSTPAEDPLVFLATSSVSGNDASSGIGLALFDQQQQLIIPNSEPASYSQITTQEMSFHFTARYRSVSKHMSPGNIRSDIWFTLVYP